MRSIFENTTFEIVEPIQQQTTVGYVGSLSLKKGMKLFAINKETNEINEAVYKKDLQTGRKQLYRQKDCVYFVAINKKNAIKKYLKSI